MQIAVLSDLHLGKKNGLDRFSRADDAEPRLVRLLERLERSVDRIVLLGDVFETLRGGAPAPLEAELSLSAAETGPVVTTATLRAPGSEVSLDGLLEVTPRAFPGPRFRPICAARTRRRGC